MNKYLIISGMALLAFASVAVAQDYSFNSDLSIGASGDDVVSLQSWLLDNGFDIPSISSRSAQKGYFGGQTRDALMKYQQSVGLPAYGFFGPMTRGHIKGGSVGASLRVISPNGGETWVKGTMQNITWTGARGILNQTGDIKLEFPMPACATSGTVHCMIAVRAPLTVASRVDLSSGSYAWNVGSIIPMTASGYGVVADVPVVDAGQYKIQICPTTSSDCDESNDYFTIVSNPSSGNAPVINGVDAPTTLAVGQTGTWTIRATDPQNGTLSYSILWGDEPGYAVTGGTIAVPAVMQTSTFAHSYSNAGVYTVTVTVRNSSGLTTQTSATVQVTGVPDLSWCPGGYICTPVNPILLRVCPSHMIINTMPSPGNPNASSSYYILNGRSHQLSEFDQSWVSSNCIVPIMRVE